MNEEQGVSATPTGLSSFGSSPQAVSPAAAASIPNADELDQLADALEALLAATTPGEWVWYQNGWAPAWTGQKMEFVKTDHTFNGVGAGDFGGGDWSVTAFQGDGPNGENNAKFIACAKNWMPALIVCVRSLREVSRHLFASGIEARSGETRQGLDPKGESPAPKGDAL